MKERLSKADVAAALVQMADDLTAEAETLRELDAAIGDGDLGITVTLGFQAVKEALPGLLEGDLSSLVMKSGMAFNRKAASTFGALFATMLMRAGREVRDMDDIGLEQVAVMVSAAVAGVQERGKAQAGDKTMLDALIPASEALLSAKERGATLSEALHEAASAAERGAEATKAMISKAGRSRWFAERTEGAQDPGATATWMMFRSLAGFVGESG